MKNYILKIAGGTVLAVFADIFSPPGYKKYMGAVTGIILIAIVMSPVEELKNIELGLTYAESEASSAVNSGEQIYGELLKKEFSERIATDVRERIREEFSKDVSAEVTVETNDDGGISKIVRIVIIGTEPDEKISERIAYVYDVDEVVMNGGK